MIETVHLYCLTPVTSKPEKQYATIEPSDNPVMESKRLLNFCRPIANERPFEFGLVAMRKNMEMAEQIWNKELYTRKTDYNVLNWNDDLTQYGMPSLMLVKLSAFLFLMIYVKYDIDGSVRNKLYYFLKDSPCYSMIADNVFWIIEEIADQSSRNRVRQNDLLGFALNIVNDASLFKFFGLAGFQRVVSNVYTHVNIDEDEELDKETQQKMRTTIIDLAEKQILGVDLSAYFRTSSAIQMITNMQNNLRVFIDTKFMI